jgi:hypothetical protein
MKSVARQGMPIKASMAMGKQDSSADRLLSARKRGWVAEHLWGENRIMRLAQLRRSAIRLQAPKLVVASILVERRDGLISRRGREQGVRVTTPDLWGNAMLRSWIANANSKADQPCRDLTQNGAERACDGWQNGFGRPGQNTTRCEPPTYHSEFSRHYSC